MASVRIEQRPGLGNVLVATEDIGQGQQVVAETPLLFVPMLKPSSTLYRPLQTYFEQHRVPPSVVLKIMAFVTAAPSTQESVLRCFCPEITAYEDAAVVQQARVFATCLLQHPPVPELAEWANSQRGAGAAGSDTPPVDATTAAAGGAAAADSADADAEELAPPAAVGQEVQRQHPQAFNTLMRGWLIFCMNGHSFNAGSALFSYGSKLTHTCAGPNTMYRTARGDVAAVVEPVDGSAGGGGGGSGGGVLRQQAPSAAAGGPAAAAAAAGVHVALVDISSGDLLTTNYLGMGHKRLMSTPARQKYLQDKFLFKCTCDRCTRELDLSRGLPCPSCSTAFRADDRLLKEQEALPDWQVGQRLVVSTTAVAADGAGAGTTAAGADTSSSLAGAGGAAKAPTSTSASDGGSGSSSSQCGYIYCDMAALLSGAAKPWKCDVCADTYANDTAELWGRYYTKSHATIESEMEGWVNRLDESMDSAPLVREPSVLHQRVLGVVRLLGPRHWASWRLLLLGVELHCGAIEEAGLRLQLRQRQASRAAAAQATTSATTASSGSGSVVERSNPAAAATADAPEASAAVFDPAAAATITQLAVWVVRYCRQLWGAVAGKYGETEAGQVLGYHFGEVCQVLLQTASAPGALPQSTASGLVDAALQLELLVLPGLRTIMGPAFNPLAQLLGPDSLQAVATASGGGAASVDVSAVAAAVRRQMQRQAAEANQMVSLVRELKQLEARDGV